MNKLLNWLYLKLKAKIDPRTGCEMRIMYDPKLDYIHANCASLPTVFVGEKEDDPTTWVYLDEFGIPKQDLTKNLELDSMINGWIWDFFRNQLNIKKEAKCCLCQLRPITRTVIRDVTVNKNWLAHGIKIPICDECQYRIGEVKENVC